jgi:2-polyprenyl-6-hydroxyphenyl methylase / 3-demethylubiquinone-9 3-methyltransferase
VRLTYGALAALASFRGARFDAANPVIAENETLTLVNTSIDPSEVEKFSKIAAEWWDPKGKFRPLHKFNPVRLAFIRDRICENFGRKNTQRNALAGLRVLDVGCGGGLVSEPMARMGAEMTSIDASERNIKTALTHARESGLEIDYRHCTVEDLIAQEEPPFDVVLNLEVVEHVANVEQFLEDSASLVRPGGLMILATINKTVKALLTAKITAEYILRWLPPGTHDPRKFVAPETASAPMKRAGLEVDPAYGVSYNPLGDKWSIGSDASVNYMLVAKRPFAN